MPVRKGARRVYGLAGVRVKRFRWLPERPIPSEWDLRLCGWILLEPGECAPASCPVLTDLETARCAVHGVMGRAAAMILGLEDTRARAHALALGFGDAISYPACLEELEQRALRIADALHAVPRQRQHGSLILDLILRDGLLDSRRLGLHPREFSLLWRLARQPGRPVSAEELMSEVWQMNFRPETNSLAVHVCRLRAKLASAGLPGAIGTTAGGGYFLSSPTAAHDRIADQRRIAEGGRTVATRTGRKQVSHDI